jgi:hypothetical protein
MKSFKLLLASVFALTALVIPASTSTAATGQPAVKEERSVSTTGSEASKLPSVAVGGGVVHIGWGVPNKALYAGRADETSGDFNPGQVGSIGNNSTYVNAAVAVGSDNIAHYAWIEGGGTIKYRNLRPGQGEIVAARFEDFANGLSLAVKGTNEIFISWRHQGDDPNGYIRFAYSNNGGASWPIVTDVPIPAGTYAGKPYLAAGPNNGPVFLTWTGVDGRIYVGQWNGSNFSPVCVSCFRPELPTDMFNPTISVGPDGRPYAAWRSVGRGVFYASRQDNGSWGISNQFSHSEVAGPVSIEVDSQNNVHLAWISKQSGNFETWYSVQPRNGSFSEPIIVSRDNGAFKANVDMTAIAKPGHATAHIVWESFANGQRIRYSRVQTDGIGCSGATVSEQAEGRPAIQGILRNPIYFPMVSKPPVVTPPPTC